MPKLHASLGRITNLDRYYQLDLHFRPERVSEPPDPSRARQQAEASLRQARVSILIYKEDAERLTLPELEAEALRRFRLHIKPGL